MPFSTNTIPNPVGISGDDVVNFLGRGDDEGLVTLAEEHLPVIAAFARNHTRGRGFTAEGIASDLLAVILTATARLVVNPSQITRQAVGVNGEVSQETVGAFAGWTIAELMVLNSYRRRSA